MESFGKQTLIDIADGGNDSRSLNKLISVDCVQFDTQNQSYGNFAFCNFIEISFKYYIFPIPIFGKNYLKCYYFDVFIPNKFQHYVKFSSSFFDQVCEVLNNQCAWELRAMAPKIQCALVSSQSPLPTRRIKCSFSSCDTTCTHFRDLMDLE